MRTREGRGAEEIVRFDKRMRAIFGQNPLRKASMGKYGELVVIDSFKRNGLNVSEVGTGNLTPYDLIVNGHKIEVRSSEVKKEWAFPKNIAAWGWKLQTKDRKNKPKQLKWEFIILVQLFDNWKKYKMYWYSRGEVEKMRQTYFAGYQSVARCIYLFKNDIEEAQRYDKHKMITQACINFNRNPRKRLLDWNKLKSLLV